MGTLNRSNLPFSYPVFQQTPVWSNSRPCRSSRMRWEQYNGIPIVWWWDKASSPCHYCMIESKHTYVWTSFYMTLMDFWGYVAWKKYISNILGANSTYKNFLFSFSGLYCAMQLDNIPYFCFSSWLKLYWKRSNIRLHLDNPHSIFSIVALTLNVLALSLAWESCTQPGFCSQNQHDSR